MTETRKIRFWRLYLAGSLLILLFILSSLKLWTLQIGEEGKKLKEKATKQFYMEISLPAKRGIIYDRKNRPLTLNMGNVEVYQHQGLSKKSIVALRKLGLSPVYKKHFNGIKWIGYTSFEFIDSLEHIKRREKGHISYYKYWIRTYTIEEGYSSLIGYIKKDRKKIVGLSGLEKILDPYLRGKDGKLPVIKGALNSTEIFTLEKKKIDPIDGKNVKITVDAYIQEIAYAALKEKVDELSAKGGFVIITNPQNGEILSMVSYPVKHNRNFVLSYPYEPGSTFKIVAYSRALDDGIINPFDSIDTEEGKLVVDDRTIKDVHRMGKITWLEAFSHSSNVAAAKLALKLGRKKMYEQILKLGFGCPTGSFLRGELRPPGNYKNWKDSKLATLGIGYGLLINGLQMAMAYGAVANGGYLYSPKILYYSEPVKIRKALHKRSVKYLKLFMRNVVENGTGKKARIENVAICGKTGTAMVYDRKLHRYNPKRKVTSFIGFFPCNSPEYLIYVVIFEPKGTPWLMYGGEVAAPVFKKIALKLLYRRLHENI